jgi:fluoroquinolone resistance protein
MSTTHEGKDFKHITWDEKRVPGRTFEVCTFDHCSFSNTDFATTKFIDCTFENCNLTMIKVDKASMQQVVFKDCKMLGIDFSLCNGFLFDVRFERCILDFSYFYQRNLKKTKFLYCSLRECNFTACDLTDAVFDNSNLEKAFFNNTLLKGTDFTTAYNFIINPDENKMKKTRFSLDGLPGLLTKHDIIIT